MKEIKKLVTNLILYAIYLFSAGVVLSKLWEWFIQNLFNTIPLSISESVGIVMVVSFLKVKLPNQKERDRLLSRSQSEEVIDGFYGIYIIYMSLLLGYIVHLFIG